MSSLRVLMVLGVAGLLLSAMLTALPVQAWRASSLGLAIAGSIALAAAGVVAVFGELLVWQPFSWYPFGRAGIQVDNLAGFFLLLTGLVAAPLFIAARSEERRLALVLRPLLVLCVVSW